MKVVNYQFPAEYSCYSYSGNQSIVKCIENNILPIILVYVDYFAPRKKLLPINSNTLL